MLQIIIPSREVFDETTETFFTTKEYVLNLEHSLLSISKWESKHHRPFLSSNPNDKRTSGEMLDYIKCMTLNKNIPDYTYLSLSEKDIVTINDYINDPMTATTVKESKRFSREIITSEIIYYWMISFNIPFDCEKWHINRLIMLIKVCNSMSKQSNGKQKPDLISRRALNEARLAKAKAKR